MPLDEWENLREVSNNAVLCYIPVRNKRLTADSNAESNLLTFILSAGK